MAKITIPELKKKKVNGEKITMLTAYDYPTAKLLQKAEIDLILVGDSVGNVILGYHSTVEVSMEEMIHHTKAVRRGAPESFIIGDMPFLSYQVSDEDAVKNAGRFIKEGGCDAVKVEGGREVGDRIAAIIKAGIPVMGHLGLTPQTATMLGGLKVQGRDIQTARKIYEDSILLERLGCFAIVLECVPAQLAKLITDTVTIPVIGIGAGKDCDGQVLVFQDLIGLIEGFRPKFVKQYLKLHEVITDAVFKFKQEVQNGNFPSQEYSFSMKQENFSQLLNEVKQKK